MTAGLRRPPRNRTLMQVADKDIYLAAWTHLYFVTGLRSGQAHDMAEDAVAAFWASSQRSVAPTPPPTPQAPQDEARGLVSDAEMLAGAGVDPPEG